MGHVPCPICSLPHWVAVDRQTLGSQSPVPSPPLVYLGNPSSRCWPGVVQVLRIVIYLLIYSTFTGFLHCARLSAGLRGTEVS